jgi:hypothetical protein
LLNRNARTAARHICAGEIRRGINALRSPGMANWFKILRNSGFLPPLLDDQDEKQVSVEQLIPTITGKIFTDRVCELTHPRIQKRLVLFLYGESNAAKTSSVEPVYSLYPPNRVFLVGKSKNSNFQFDGLLDNKQICLLEEFSFESYGIKKDDMKSFLEGARMKTAVKNVKDEEGVNTARIILTSNDINGFLDLPLIHADKNRIQGTYTNLNDITVNPNTHKYVDAAFKNRIEFIRMFPMKKIIPGEKQKMMLYEKGLIILYLGLQYFGDINHVSDPAEMREIERLFENDSRNIF